MTDLPEHQTRVEEHPAAQLVAASCTCGGSKVIEYARAGTGPPVAVRLAELHAARHRRDPQRWPLGSEDQEEAGEETGESPMTP